MSEINWTFNGFRSLKESWSLDSISARKRDKIRYWNLERLLTASRSWRIVVMYLRAEIQREENIFKMHLLWQMPKCLFQIVLIRISGNKFLSFLPVKMIFFLSHVSCKLFSPSKILCFCLFLQIFSRWIPHPTDLVHPAIGHGHLQLHSDKLQWGDQLVCLPENNQ